MNHQEFRGGKSSARQENDITCVVTIPVYKDHPNEVEIASFKQCLTVLSKHDVVLFTHNQVNLSEYQRISEELGKPVKVEYFSKEYFTSVASYNKLCFQCAFYKRFVQYEYMLIYQLDAWVFNDKLEEWCAKGYDYVGALIFQAPNNDGEDYKLLGVGQGGFSLRRVSWFVNRLSGIRQFCPVLSPKSIFKHSSHMRHANMRNMEHWNPVRFYIKETILVLLRLLGVANNMFFFARRPNISEDLVFGAYSEDALLCKPKLPNYLEAAKFSFEMQPEKLFHKIGETLPFGCHGFERCDYTEFWKQYIGV